MPSLNINSLSADALLSLRSDIDKRLASMRADLHKQLARLGDSDAPEPGVRKARRGPLKGTKVPAKYRGPDGETWAGRGAQPKWLVRLLKQGKKLEDFLIKKAGAKPGRKAKAK
jgi:DNA-binding protein H-NS